MERTAQNKLAPQPHIQNNFSVEAYGLANIFSRCGWEGGTKLVLEVGLTPGAHLTQSADPMGDYPRVLAARHHLEVSAQRFGSHLLLHLQLLMDRLSLVERVTLRRDWILLLLQHVLIRRYSRQEQGRHPMEFLMDIMEVCQFYHHICREVRE